MRAQPCGLRSRIALARAQSFAAADLSPGLVQRQRPALARIEGAARSGRRLKTEAGWGSGTLGLGLREVLPALDSKAGRTENLGCRAGG